MKCCQEPITRSIGKSGFRILQSNASERISPPRNPSSGWISIKKFTSGFHGFPFYRSMVKSEKGFAKLFSWTAVFFLLLMRARARPLFLRTVFQTLFRISQSNGKKKKNPNTYISGCVRFGNLDLDFKIRISYLRSNAKSEKGFQRRGCVHLGNPDLLVDCATFM